MSSYGFAATARAARRIPYQSPRFLPILSHAIISPCYGKRLDLWSFCITLYYMEERCATPATEGFSMNEYMSLPSARRALTLTGDYGAGYLRGLRRAFYGSAFGTDAEHRLWLSLGQDGDPSTELGRGYRDGFSGAEAAPKRGRPRGAKASARTAPPRTIRLTDDQWAALKARGGAAALRAWLSE